MTPRRASWRDFVASRVARVLYPRGAVAHRISLLVLAIVGCAEPAGERGVEPEGEPRSPVVFRECVAQDLPLAAPAGFRWFSNRIISATGAWHEADDAIAVDGSAVTLRAKLSYGPTSKDLEDEWVQVWIDRCDRVEMIARVRTDDDGRVAVKLGADDTGTIGRHTLGFVVEGDATIATSTLWVVPPKTRVAVFDIDGTLTSSDWELFEDLVDDLFVPIADGEAPKARDGAAEITQARADQGYLPVYLTGRPYWLSTRSRAWLDDRGMAPGPLFTARRTSQVMPTESGVGAYKADLLGALQLAGLDIDLAYGNASTDIFAYAEAGIDPAATFIVGTHGGEHETVDLGEGYAAHLDDAPFDAIEQPFAWP